MAYQTGGAATNSSVAYMKTLFKGGGLSYCKRCQLMRSSHPASTRTNYPSAYGKETNPNLLQFNPGRSPINTFQKRNISSSPQALSEKRDGERDCNEQRSNGLHVQMLSRSLHEQLFKSSEGGTSPAVFEEVKKHLEKFDLWEKKANMLPDVDLTLPKLFGENIDQHFQTLAVNQTQAYKDHADQLAQSDLAPKPKKWAYTVGWTRYGRDGTVSPVDFPLEEAVVFDIETLVPEGQCPTMATAASTEAWYSWCSERLVNRRYYWSSNLRTRDMIPLETASDSALPPDGEWKKRLVIGHNVGFDRSFVKEQYYPRGPRTRFLDTMSLHIATNGLTTFQRMLFQAKKSGSRRKEVQEAVNNPYFGEESPMDLDWISKSSLNNLHDVHQLYTKGTPLQKEKRNIFVTGTMEEIREDFQNLMSYCARDVEATHEVFQGLWPVFLERFPHPVTLGGMLEMSTAYLPVNRNWQRYIEASQNIFNSLQHELKVTLMGLANSACKLLEDQRYSKDVWLWDLDWTCQKPRIKKVKLPKSLSKDATAKERAEAVINYVHNSKPARPPHMLGYPEWYRELCPRDSELGEDVMPGPSKITTLKRVTPKLLRLTYQGYPLHYSRQLGWGYLVPGRDMSTAEEELEQELFKQEENVDGVSDEFGFPLRELYKVCKEALKREVSREEVDQELRMKVLESLEMKNYDDSETSSLWEQLAAAGDWKPKRVKKGTPMLSGPWFHEGDGPYAEVNIPGCWFFRLPHKDGPGNSTGNPLSKDNLKRIESGEMVANCSTDVNTVLKRHIMCAYWKNNEQRIRSQMVVRLEPNDLPGTVTEDMSYDSDNFFGAILPRVVTAGTVTRRAVESTWLTASNAREDRIGSELKSMIQAPPGYKFVGADVDSQELWIAALLGDANFAKEHGCTAFGWMTLLGNKAEGTDLHSRIAEQVGISREEAKIFNYGRIYGAGNRFAERLLQQFNPKMTPAEAKQKATALYSYSKGKRKRIMAADQESIRTIWQGGTESYMFNMLEAIANSEDPRTPVLGCKISKSLEPRNVSSHFMTSRVNWVVQSSAVDYLHLMLVSMRWLLDEYDIDGRFSISIHDEVRYMVSSKDVLRAALALQITNLLVRSMFAYKLGMDDLPQAVAFFSSVDIDTCLRKEVNMDCVTPSNPQGLQRGYNIPQGEALTIYDIMERTTGSLENLKLGHEGNDTELDDMDMARLAMEMDLDEYQT